MKNKSKIYKQCLLAFGVMLNIVGAMIAVQLKLPIYIDSIGTIFIGIFLGSKYGMLTGLLSSVVNGMTFDIYSLYYMPVQLLLGALSGTLLKFQLFTKKRLLLAALWVAIPASLIGSIITAFVFGGITSSGTTYVIALLHQSGLSLTMSCFIVQVFTDYVDKLVVLALIYIVSRHTSIQTLLQEKKDSL